MRRRVGSDDCRGMANSVYGFDSGCQVCNICFSRHSHEFVSTHGFSLNQIFVWNYKPFALTATPPEKTRGVPGSAGGYPLIDALVNLPDDDAPEEDASENLVEKTATLSGVSAKLQQGTHSRSLRLCRRTDLRVCLVDCLRPFCASALFLRVALRDSHRHGGWQGR